MTQIEKLYTSLVETRAPMRFADFDRISGSHHIYKHPAISRRMSIQPRDGQAKPYQIDQFLDIVEEFGIEMKK